MTSKVSETQNLDLNKYKVDSNKSQTSSSSNSASIFNKSNNNNTGKSGSADIGGMLSGKTKNKPENTPKPAQKTETKSQATPKPAQKTNITAQKADNTSKKTETTSQGAQKTTPKAENTSSKPNTNQPQKPTVKTSKEQTQALNSIIKSHNAAQKAFDKQMKDDGWAGDFADGVSALWGSDNRASKVREDLKQSKQNVNELTKAAQQGDTQFKSKFKDIYGVDYNQKAINEYNKNPSAENYKKAFGTKQKDISSRVDNYNKSQQTGAAVVKTTAKIGAGVAIGVATGGTGLVAVGAAALGTAAASAAIEETDRMKIGKAVTEGKVEFREGTDHKQILKDAAWDGAAVLAGSAVAKGATAIAKGSKAVKAAATVAGDVATGAAQEKLQTGDVTLTGTMINATMSGVGSAAEAGLLKKGYQALKSGAKKAANNVSDGMNNAKARFTPGKAKADVPAAKTNTNIAGKAEVNSPSSKSTADVTGKSKVGDHSSETASGVSANKKPYSKPTTETVSVKMSDDIMSASPNQSANKSELSAKVPENKTKTSESGFKPVKTQEEAEQLYKSMIDDNWLKKATPDQPMFWDRGGEPWAYAVYDTGEPVQGTPWKMHLYADSPEEWGNVAQVAMPYMHENKIGYKTMQDISPEEFQALRDTKTAGGAESQQGKAFTLYFENEEQFLQAAKDLDAKFANSGLKSSGKVAHEGQIGDSGFISYRHEGAERGVKYKPDDVTDPYQAMLNREQAFVKGDADVKAKTSDDVIVADKVQDAQEPEVRILSAEEAEAANAAGNVAYAEVVRSPQEAVNAIANVHPEQRAMLEQIAKYPNMTAADIDNISVAMTKYPQHAKDIASVVKNRNIKTGITLSGDPSPDMDNFVLLLEKHPDRKDDIVDYLSIQRRDINDTSNPFDNVEDYLAVLDRHPEATATVKELAKNPNLGINDIDILTRMSQSGKNPNNGAIIQALSNKKYTREGIQKKLNTIEKYPKLKDALTSDAPTYALIDKTPANTPIEAINRRFEIRDRLEQNYAEDLQMLKTTLGDSYYNKVRWEDIIPANASEPEIKSILKELNDESKFFARLDINEYKYGKNAQWAYEMNRISKTAETRMANGENFDDVISGIARDYRSYDEAGTLASNSVDAIYGGDRRVCSGVYRGIKDPAISPSGCYTTEFDNKNAYSEYFDKFSIASKSSRTAPYDDVALTQVKMENETLGNMIHPSKEAVDPAMKHIEDRYNELKPLFEKVSQGKQLTPEEIKFADQKIAESYYIMGNTMPWRRGSNGISDIYMRSCYKALGIEQPALRRGISLDLESFCTNMDEYRNKWGSYFEERTASAAKNGVDNMNVKIENLEGEIKGISYYDDDLFDNLQAKIDALPDDSKAKTYLQKELNNKIMAGLPTKEEYSANITNG